MRSPAATAADSSKCCSAILRRLLCSGGLPTHPSESDDHFILREIQKLPNFTKPAPAPAPAPAANGKQNVSSPGVVARLMGLDSLPNPSLVQKDTSLAALLRSKSVNSIDFLLHFDPVTKGQLQHRRVRTSVSFREGVNDECISAVLEREKVDGIEARKKDDQKGGKECKPRREKGDFFQEKRAAGKKGSKRVEMEEKKKPCFDEHVTVTPQKKDFQGTRTRVVVKPVKNYSKEELKDSKCVKKRKNKLLAHKPESNLNLKKIYPQGSVPAGVRSTKPVLPENGISQSQKTCSVRPQDSGKGEVTAIIERKIEKKMKGSEEKCYSTRMVEEICRVTEEDVKENWECGMVLGFGDFEEICQMFGQEILHVLLMQLVDEVVLFYGRREISVDCI